MSVANQYQFARMQLASRSGLKGHATRNSKSSAKDLFAEMSREPAACGHVAEPATPTIVYDRIEGWAPKSDPIELIAAASQRHVESAELGRVYLKNGRVRKVRTDTATARFDVYSYPVSCADIENDANERQRFDEWSQKAVLFAIADVEKRGGVVQIVVVHKDENYPHLHVVSTIEGRADVLHPGRSAKTDAYASHADTRQANVAYKRAMASWQDEFHNQVSSKFGHNRVGPKRRRTTYATAIAENKALERQRTANTIFKTTQSETDRLVAENAALKEEMAALEKQKRLAEKEIKKAQAEVIRVQSEIRRDRATIKHELKCAVGWTDRAKERKKDIDQIWRDLSPEVRRRAERAMANIDLVANQTAPYEKSHLPENPAVEFDVTASRASDFQSGVRSGP